MGAHGKPFWKAQSQPDSLIKVTMTNGDVIYIHPADNIRQVEWGSPGTDITDLSNISTVAAANMDFKGKVNTKVIVSQLGNNGGKAYAAKLCDDLVAYGYDDWYLPAAGELNEMYKKPGPVANGGSGQITTGFYWSSSEYTNGFAWGQYFVPGDPVIVSKGSSVSCRCVRR